MSTYLNNEFHPSHGPAFDRHDPASGALTWSGNAADEDDVNDAVAAAAQAAPAWAALSLEDRAGYLTAFAGNLPPTLAEIISNETGKPHWESLTEVESVRGKISLTIAAQKSRHPGTSTQANNQTAATRYRPLGVAAVLGPFNFPAHLPNGQIIPALLAGNTAVFKPSELTPATGEAYARAWQAANLPPGVFNMIQGGRETGALLAGHPRIDALYFTGSYAAGVALSKLLAPHPEKLLALEMGGNNALVATRVNDFDAAVYTIIQSAFITAGQRCTCARRLVLLNDAEGDQLLARLIALTKNIKVGPHTSRPEPFMGPVISEAAKNNLLTAHAALLKSGATDLLAPQSPGPAFLTPAILDVSAVSHLPDSELFGPILQVIRVPDFDSALDHANRTRYGLAATLLSADPTLWQRFQNEIRAGILNWNRPTTGASGALPFGGLGQSGNHRPAGAAAIDFCEDPIATLESPTLTLPKTLSPGITFE